MESRKSEEEEEEEVDLSKEQLRSLAKMIQWQEQERIKSVPFRSERDRSDYLRCSRETYEQTLALLDDHEDLAVKAEEYNDNGDRVSVVDVVHEYLDYLKVSGSFGLKMVKNLHLRNDYLKKVQKNAKTFAQRIEELRNGSFELPEFESKANALIEEMAVQKETFYKCVMKKASKSSQSFSKAIKRSGNSFEGLVSKYQKKLAREKGPEFNKPFEYLEDEQKIEVYDEIVKASGKGTYLKNLAYKVADVIGKGLIIFALAMAVWDIYSSEHKWQTATKLAAGAAGGWAGGYVGEIAGAAVATYLVTSCEVAATAATAVFVGMATFVSGIGLAFAVGWLAGYVVDQIFASGGKHTGGAIKVNDDDDQPKRPALLNHPRYQQLYVAPMPDGALLARQLAYMTAPAAKPVVA